MEPVLETPSRQSRRARVPVRPSRRYAFLGIGVVAGVIVGLILGLILGLALTLPSNAPPLPEPQALLMAPYHAVRLSSGQVLVGRVDKLASPYTIVSEAYVVQSAVNAETKQVSWSLVARGTDWDSPATVILGAQQVVSIEAIKPGSKLSELLEELRTRK